MKTTPPIGFYHTNRQPEFGNYIDVMPTLKADNPPAVCAPLPFDTTQVTSPANRSNPQPGDPCHPLARGAHAPAIAFTQNQREEVRAVEVAGALPAEPGTHQSTFIAEDVTTLAIRGRGDSHNLETRTDGTANAVLTPNGGRAGIGVGAVHYGMQVRRLTPMECERLQGFRDGYTLIPVGKKMAADGPRYKALGNSMAVPVMRWIGHRIQCALYAEEVL